MYRGDIRLGDTIDFKFSTRKSDGVPTTLAGTPVISAYVGNSVTQITAGITLTVDFDAVTGLHNVRVVATSGNGFATASNYDLVITTGTVNSVSVVGEVIGSFSIEARSAVMPTVAARTLDVSAGGEAGLDWANIGNKTTVNDFTQTNVGTVGVVDGDVQGNVIGLTIETGTATGGGASTITLKGGSSADDFYKDTIVVAGTESRTIIGFVDATRVATVNKPWINQPVNGTAYVILPTAVVSNIKQNQALASFPFLMTDSTTHAPVAGKTVTVTRSIDGAAAGAGTLSAVTEVTGITGAYKVDFAAADMNGKVILLQGTASGCDVTVERIVTQP